MIWPLFHPMTQQLHKSAGATVTIPVKGAGPRDMVTRLPAAGFICSLGPKFSDSGRSFID